MGNKKSVIRDVVSSGTVARIALFTAALTLLACIGTTVRAAEVALQWEPSASSHVEGYKLYYHKGLSAPPYTGTGAVQGDSPILLTKYEVAQEGNEETCQFTVTGLDEGETYYFAVTAYDSSYNESDYSNEVCFNCLYDYECRLVPTKPVVSPGGSLEFEVVFTNNTNQHHYFLFGTNVTTPNGNGYPDSKYLFGPVWVFLGPYRSKSNQLVQLIPEDTRPGLYTYHGYVGKLGVGIHHQSQFVFAIDGVNDRP